MTAQLCGTMLILALGDLHFQQRFFNFVTAQAREGRYDAICLVGDFLDMFPNAKRPLDQQVAWVLDWFKKLPTGRTRVFAVSGNHDWSPGEADDDRDAEARWLQRARRKGVAVDGDITRCSELDFVCQPWVGAVEPAAGSPPVVWLAHAPPADTECAKENGWDAGGDWETRWAAESLTSGLMLSGHVHSPDSWADFAGTTLCLNAGANLEADVPNHLVIDTTARRAHWVGSRGLKGPMQF